jgi:uncharacterized RDD family membrane protein YckC
MGIPEEGPSMGNCSKCGSELSEGAGFCPKCGTPVKHIVEQPKLAYWGERFVAWIIDIVIVGAIVGFLRLLVGATWPGYVWSTNLPSWFPFSDFGTSNIVYFLYWMLSEGMYGQSFGKIIMRIKVARLNGGVPNLGQTAIESVGKAFLLPIDVIVGWLVYPSRRQRLFNYLSNTVVVRTIR